MNSSKSSGTFLYQDSGGVGPRTSWNPVYLVPFFPEPILSKAISEPVSLEEVIRNPNLKWGITNGISWGERIDAITFARDIG